jgi:hypothetical protein
MDLTQSLADAGIARIAIVDDDLSERISTDDLLTVDRDLPAVLADPHDPDRTAYLALLTRLGREPDDLADLAESLSDPEVRAAAPERLRTAAERVLAVRHENAEPIRRIQRLLEAVGVLHENIDLYSTAQIPADRHYDLIVVDYFLVEGSQEHTLPFIASVLEVHGADRAPLQVILMSSHETELKAVFQELRPKLEVSSSRMRIMGKPATDDQLLQWKLALYQLAADRASVRTVEAFARAAARAAVQAGKDLAQSVWELDLQAMDLLNETAVADNDDYSRYVEECLSRQLLARLESIADMRAALIELGSVLGGNRATKTTSPSAEIGDSRAAISALMRSMEWRGGTVALGSPYPVAGDHAAKTQWVRSCLRFGMVLRAPDGGQWLNITQACDLAQARDDELTSTCLLLVGSHRHGATEEPDRTAIVSMTTAMGPGENDVLGWNLLWTYTPTVDEFGGKFANGWSVVGEMRVDQAQNVAVEYAARTARIGLPRPLTVWRLEGLAMRVSALRDAEGTDALAGTGLVGHARARASGADEIHIDRPSFDSLLRAYPGSLDDRAMRLYLGIQVKSGKRSDGLPPVLYCVSKPDSMGALRISFANEQWLRRAENGDNVIIAIWPAWLGPNTG